jgi:hypothetical protein
MQCMYDVTIRRVGAITVEVLKQSECVSVALGIRHAKRMRYIVICKLVRLHSTGVLISP